MVYSGAWGKLIHEKNQNQKSRDTVPLRLPVSGGLCTECKRSMITICYSVVLQKRKQYASVILVLYLFIRIVIAIIRIELGY